MNDDAWEDIHLAFVGVSRKRLGLANPFAYRNERHSISKVSSKQEALDEYRKWLIEKCIARYKSGLRDIGLEHWEKMYLSRVVILAKKIQAQQITSLGCWCINSKNYIPVPDGYERCHAEILYKACLSLIDFWRKIDNDF